MTVLRDSRGRFIKGNQYWLGKKGIKKANSGSFKKGLIPWNKGKRTYKSCEECGKDFSTNKGKMTKPKQRFCSLSCFGTSQRGKNYGKVISKMKPYKRWKAAILKRDRNRCIWCGSTKDLHIDHIKPKSKYPNLKFKVSNGRTLCFECHKRTKSYGKHL